MNLSNLAAYSAFLFHLIVTNGFNRINKSWFQALSYYLSFCKNKTMLKIALIITTGSLKYGPIAAWCKHFVHKFYAHLLFWRLPCTMIENSSDNNKIIFIIPTQKSLFTIIILYYLQNKTCTQKKLSVRLQVYAVDERSPNLKERDWFTWKP